MSVLMCNFLSLLILKYIFTFLFHLLIDESFHLTSLPLNLQSYVYLFPSLRIYEISYAPLFDEILFIFLGFVETLADIAALQICSYVKGVISCFEQETMGGIVRASKYKIFFITLILFMCFCLAAGFTSKIKRGAVRRFLASA